MKDLILKNRSYRRFYQSEKIEKNTLLELIDLARLSPSGANLQPLRHIISNDESKNEKVFSTLSWAGFLADWHGPKEGEKPSGYIVILSETDAKYDVGIACQSILLGAVEKGLGGCIFASINRDKLRTLLQIPAQYEIMLTLAIGKPKEEIVIEKMKNNEFKYWRDDHGVHHVPKRDLKDIIID
ncbi:MAG: nitroreductase family protein [Candidatus Cloacimonetes bacterium]|nr:nitroreductase family protein [Candidatus Cloacimonadota bacterium]